jgi:hypothetical protein
MKSLHPRPKKKTDPKQEAKDPTKNRLSTAFDLTLKKENIKKMQ